MVEITTTDATVRLNETRDAYRTLKAGILNRNPADITSGVVQLTALKNGVLAGLGGATEEQVSKMR